MNFHTSKEFERELLKIKSDVLDMGRSVESMISHALRGFEKGDMRLLKEVLFEEKKVNRLEVDIDEMCSHVLAIRQPTAADMRFLVASTKMIKDLERMGDEAEKVARMAILFYEHSAPNTPSHRISEMASLVGRMLSLALQAYEQQSESFMRTVLKEDAKVDDHFRDTLRIVILGMVEDVRTISRGIDLIFMAKALERIGDHSKNIMEHIVYMIEGRDPRVESKV